MATSLTAWKKNHKNLELEEQRVTLLPGSLTQRPRERKGMPKGGELLACTVGLPEPFKSISRTEREREEPEPILACPPISAPNGPASTKH